VRAATSALAASALLASAVPATATAVTFTVTYADNVQSDFATRGWLSAESPFQRNIRAALDIWGAAIDSDRVLRLSVEASRAVARTGGTFSNGRLVGRDAAGRNIFEPGPLSRILTGANPGGATDMFLRVNAAFVQANYWFDPTPANRGDETPPQGRSDFVSIVLHEVGHALGFAGTRKLAAGPGYGTVADFVNPFDVLSRFGGTSGNPLTPAGSPNPMFFTGAQAKAVFGHDVPLSHVGPNHPLHAQDFYHFGTCGAPPLIGSSLMNGCRVPIGAEPRLVITDLDKAALRDLGYQIR
jgi:hypothetical protein